MTTSVPPSNGGWEEIALPLTLSPEASPASPSPSPVSGAPRKTSGGSGRQRTWSFATYDPDTRSWRTSRVSLDGEWETYSQTWPQSGMTRNGTAFPRPRSARFTDATASSSLPTPTASEGGTNRSPSPNALIRPTLSQMARKASWPTPRATDGERGGRGDLLAAIRTGRSSRRRDWRLLPTPLAKDGARGGLSIAAQHRREAKSQTGLSLPEELGGPLNPTWVEWLMGFPPGWTD